ncbi:MAG TPA: hypothetical protein VIV64_05325 [Gammaproteobacteria bacterium]
MTDRSQPEIHDFADAEHCVLEDVTVEHPKIYPEYLGSREPSEVIDEFVIGDPIRRSQTTVRIYAEGWLDIESGRPGKNPHLDRINLRYIDAVPTMERFYPVDLIKVTGIMAAVAVIASVPATLGWLTTYTLPTAVVAGAAAVAGSWLSFYRSHEKIVFQTLHGRAGAICLNARLGTIRRFQKIVPRLVEAIADAAQSVQEETAVYLRAEMREHYRLCNEGILTQEECAESTGRILKNFGGPL